MICANAAHFGLPQQRNRAWLMCTQKAVAAAPNELLRDLRKFQCRHLPLSSVVDPDAKSQMDKPRPKQAKKRGGAREDPKWKKGWETECGTWGKETRTLLRRLSLCSMVVLHWPPELGRPSSSLLAKEKLHKRLQVLLPLTPELTQRERCILASTVEEIYTKYGVKCDEQLMCIQVVRPSVDNLKSDAVALVWFD